MQFNRKVLLSGVVFERRFFCKYKRLCVSREHQQYIKRDKLVALNKNTYLH